MPRGGPRPNSGRKKLTENQVAERATQRRHELLDELLWPAICTAFHADPGTWNDRHLKFQLSTIQIVEAYGPEGLREWKSYFTLAKKGGRDRNGNGFKTVWVLNLNKYSFILKLIESLGHTVRDLPQPGFPPEAMLARLEAIEAKRRARQKARTVAAPVIAA